MALVALRSPLRELAGGNTELDVEGGTLREILGRLQQSYPKLEGWVVDERGAVRPHVVLFVNGEKASLETSVGERTLALGPDYRVKPDSDFFAEVRALLGETAVV